MRTPARPPTDCRVWTGPQRAAAAPRRLQLGGGALSGQLPPAARGAQPGSSHRVGGRQVGRSRRQHCRTEPSREPAREVHPLGAARAPHRAAHGRTGAFPHPPCTRPALGTCSQPAVLCEQEAAPDAAATISFEGHSLQVVKCDPPRLAIRDLIALMCDMDASDKGLLHIRSSFFDRGFAPRLACRFDGTPYFTLSHWNEPVPCILRGLRWRAGGWSEVPVVEWTHIDGPDGLLEFCGRQRTFLLAVCRSHPAVFAAVANVAGGDRLPASHEEVDQLPKIGQMVGLLCKQFSPRLRLPSYVRCRADLERQVYEAAGGGNVGTSPT